MRINTNTLFAVIILFFFNQHFNYPQNKFMLGPSVGLNINFNHGEDIKNGAGAGILLGSQTQLGITKVLGLIINIQFYDNRSAAYTIEGSRVDLDEQGNRVLVKTAEKYSAGVAYICLEPILKLSVSGGRFHFLAGASVGINVQKNFKYTYSETAPENYNGDPNKILISSYTYNGSYKNARTRIGAKFGFGYDFPVNSMSLTPQLYYDVGLSNAIKDINWKTSTLQLILALKFQL